MLGKSVGTRGCALALLLVVAACAHNVAQDKQTGKDGKIKGAKEITLDNGEGKATGIVTYPGGDRVDWRMVELPEKKKGKLEISLKWTTPRPGLQLAFDVFDEWNTVVLSSKKSTKKRAKGRSKSATLENAKGKYFIRVFAVGRGDAGKYRLTVGFQPDEAIVFDPLKLEIPDPPKLAAVPDPILPCEPFDQKNPSCASVCPEFGAPPGWPPCKDKCPNPPSADIPSCQLTMPCPNPPDRRVKACKKSQWPKCDLKNKDPQNPNCDDATADPVTGRVIRSELQGGELVITIAAGTNSGVEKGWRVFVLRGDSEAPLPGGEVTVVRVDKNTTVGKVKLTPDQIKANDRVKLSPK